MHKFKAILLTLFLAGIVVLTPWLIVLGAVHIAEDYNNHGQYAPAIPLYKTAISVTETFLPASKEEKSEMLDYFYRRLNVAYDYENQPEEAKKAEWMAGFIERDMYEAQLSTTVSALNPSASKWSQEDAGKVIEIEQELSEAYVKLGEPVSAELRLLDAESVVNTVFGAMNILNHQVLVSLGHLAQKQNDEARAEGYYRQELKVAEAQQHDEVLTSLALYHLATCCERQHKFTEAEDALRKSIVLETHALQVISIGRSGPVDDGSLADSYRHLRNVLSEAGDKAGAAKVTEELKGRFSPETLSWLDTLDKRDAKSRNDRQALQKSAP